MKIVFQIQRKICYDKKTDAAGAADPVITYHHNMKNQANTSKKGKEWNLWKKRKKAEQK